MAIRILYWNVEKFGINKIANPGRKRQRGSSRRALEAAQDRLELMETHFNVNPEPDVVVVVEVATGWDGRGRLVRGAGADGSLRLLESLRDTTAIGDDWMLVPPLQTGPREAVAVFYNSAKLVFTGPWLWPGGGGGVAQAAGGVGAYPAAFDAELPNRAIPVGARFNVGQQENRCAARVEFTYNAHAAAPGTAVDYLVWRHPYMASFAVIDNTGAVQRNLTLFAVHSPANGFSAPLYLRELAEIEQITEANAATEVRALVGDFNVNLFDGNLALTAAYGHLVGRGYTLALTPVNPAPVPGTELGYRGYYATHIKRGSNAVYWSTMGVPQYYPGYGIIGADRVQNLYAIDNAFYRYGTGLVPPAHNTTILNPIIGSPFTRIPPAVANTAQGTVGLGIQMASNAFRTPFAGPMPGQAPQFTAGRRSAFKGWDNYGFIRSTSDHLALVIDV